LEQGPNQRSREDIQQYNIVTNVNLGKLLPPNGVLTFLLITPLAKKRLLRIRPFNQDIKLKQLLDNTDDLLKDNISSRAIDYTKRMSINFIGVRKQSPEQKQQVYDPENFTFLSLTIKWSDMILRLKIM
jgi:cell surface protein SprA